MRCGCLSRPVPPFEATDKSLSLAGLVDHFTEGSTSERLGLLKVSAHKLEFEGTEVQLFRLDHGQPSTGLRAAASATAGVLGAMVAWVAPGWGDSLKNWSAETSTQAEKIEYSRTVTTPAGEQIFETAYLSAPGKVEYQVQNSQGFHSQRGLPLVDL